MTDPVLESNGIPIHEREDPDHEEYQYLDLISKIMLKGQSRPDRTGTGTLSLFAPPSFRFSLENGILPLLTTKRVFLKGVIIELLWFISGSTNSNLLKEKGVGIWDLNGSKDFLEKNGLGFRKQGDLGPVYGFQWRHFGEEYLNCDTDYKGKGFDQLKDVIWKIKNNPTDRRIILSAWNPKDLHLMALPPCHMFCQFYVTLPDSNIPNDKPKLSCLMYQRSCDLGLGIPFNIASYSLLTYMIAYITDTIPFEFILQMGDSHIYKDHLEPLKIQLNRQPKSFPNFKFKRTKEEIGDIDGFILDDFIIENYKPHGKIEMKMSVSLKKFIKTKKREI
ncbi:thymidylate synthase [Kwoniella pini CBS 10737]|uniref:thymidylate synthase n=1 Tax=Kwoniella pini CBS 10737 TaxID=1296096 RepID=A0A1B9HV87_9TREE|nr:thymidylate synthase [Kwoniella pini CBS 10737]OCF47184.1 thymidylate synthase [Kwoniella pini CBS 10737]